MANKTFKQYVSEWVTDNTSPSLMGVDSSGKPVKIAKSSLSIYGVTSSSVLTDNNLIKGDGGARGIQSSGISISDTNQISGVSSITLTGTGSQEISWNTDYSTIDIPTGYGSTLQVGQEVLVKVFNNTGATISNGSAVYPTGSYGDFPTIGLAITNTHENVSVDYGMATSEIPNNDYGFVVWFGKARGLDTASYSVGDLMYISPTTPGEITNIKPTYPNYVMVIGIVFKVDPTDGIIFVTSRSTPTDTFNNFWNGTFRESFSFTTSSDGTDVVGILSTEGINENMTMVFSDGFSILDLSSGATISLTSGTDTVPQPNFVYIPISTKVLTNSIVEFPIEEHIKVSTVYLRSASSVLNDGAIINKNWDDPIYNLNKGGFPLIMERLRQLPVIWYSGVQGIATIGTSSISVSVSEGKLYQVGLESFPSFDTLSGDSVHIINHNTTPYVDVTDLSTITEDANGNSLDNSSFSFVIWGVLNDGNDVNHVVLNLPLNTYSYNSPQDAIDDPNNYSVFDIPSEYKGMGFLISRFTFRLKNSIWELLDTEDLRGYTPNISAGVGGGGGFVTQTQVGYKTNIIETASNKDYIIILNAPSDGVITKTSVVCASGTGVSSFKVVSGLTSSVFGITQSVSSTMVTQTVSENFTGGDNIVITISNVSSMEDLTYAIEYNYNLLT